MYRPDITTLEAFYASPLGKEVRQELCAVLRQIIRAQDVPFSSQEAGCAIGYALPYWPFIQAHGRFNALVMPGRQGSATVEGKSGKNAALLSRTYQLPFQDSAFQVIWCMHALEYAENPQLVLQECWRVLKPRGKLVLVAPNRIGLWARAESTPFGHGIAFYRSQLQILLEGAGFGHIEAERTLFTMPSYHLAKGNLSPIMRLLMKLVPPLSGAWVMAAEKNVYAGLQVPSQETKPEYRPVWQPSGSMRCRESANISQKDLNTELK